MTLGITLWMTVELAKIPSETGQLLHTERLLAKKQDQVIAPRLSKRICVTRTEGFCEVDPADLGPDTR